MTDKDALNLRIVDAWYWIKYNNIKLEGGEYKLAGHEYQVDWLQCNFQKQIFKKAAQMACTTTHVLKRIHGMIYGKYIQGVLYLFPTRDDVTDFSKGRFQPIISNNPSISAVVKDTDAANIKRIGNSMLYLRGARASQRIEGIKSTSSQLKSIPVDCIVFDEKDEMSPHMVTLALERVSHSEVQEEVSISTPTVPDYGIDRDYNNSDRRVRVIKCRSCGFDNFMELEFPECLMETVDGKVLRICIKCKNEIYPSDGQWVALDPSKSNDCIGWWISQLHSKYVKPKTILDMFRNPPDGNLSEFYNSKLGMAYVDAENRLTRGDVFACCGQDVIPTDWKGRVCAMGVDVGKHLHVVVGYPRGDGRYKVVYVKKVNTFDDVHDIAQRLNVKCAVIDMEPETRKVRDFKLNETYKVYLCDYQDRLKHAKKVDESEGVITVKRTEMLDRVHNIVSTLGKFEIPRRDFNIEEYATELTNTAKVLQEDEVTGSRRYIYKKLGDDHYYHATAYFLLACDDMYILSENQTYSEKEDNPDQKFHEDYNPFDYILK